MIDFITIYDNEHGDARVFSRSYSSSSYLPGGGPLLWTGACLSHLMSVAGALGCGISEPHPLIPPISSTAAVGLLPNPIRPLWPQSESQAREFRSCPPRNGSSRDLSNCPRKIRG